MILFADLTIEESAFRYCILATWGPGCCEGSFMLYPLHIRIIACERLQIPSGEEKEHKT